MTRRETLLASLPNTITVLRMAAVIPLTWLLIAQQFGAALVVAFAAGLSDAVDGFLAKRFGWQSYIGGILDPLADKLLLLSCFVVLAAQGWIPPWLLVLVLGRDLVIVVGALMFHFWFGRVEPEPSPVSKTNTFLQIALVLLVLLDRIRGFIEAEWITALVWAVTVTTVLSGIQYVWVWGRRAWLSKREEAVDE